MNAQMIKKLREERAWSQEHLAAVAGVSLRTIQRVESEGKASPETRLALASALGIDVTQLNAEGGNDSAVAAVSMPTLISWQQYRLLRFALVVIVLLGVDIYRNHALTWTRWLLLATGLVLALRWLRSRFVAPRNS
ncbi:MAG: helix-turn-helix transcriptional regulator [Formivibrio sp.]|nr:helix-turn-helix transcriptional regulator [Formivibrio sp.]